MARKRRMGSKRSSTIALDLNKMEHDLRMAILREGNGIIGELAQKVCNEANNRAPSIKMDEIMPANADSTEWMPTVRGPNKRTGDEKSGPIKGRIFAQESNKVPGSWVVCSPAWYSHFVEYGTEPHSISPNAKRGKNTLKFPGTHEYTGEMQYPSSVSHPGMQPQPFLRPASDMAEVFLKEILASRGNK